MAKKQPTQSIKYPDTREGAVQCLKDESTYDMTQVRQVIPDPSCKGVWAVDLYSGTRVIVYLKGYGYNENATMNDFEEGQP